MCNCKSNKCGCGSSTVPQGPQGAAGIAGTNGNSVLNGSGVPNSGTGNIGDFYIDLTNNEIYGPKTDSGWGTGTSLVGPQGPAGENCVCEEDTCWEDLEGFNHMNGITNTLSKPQVRRIGNVLHFRGNALVPLASDSNGNTLVTVGNDLYVSDPYAYVFQGAANQGGCTLNIAGSLTFNLNGSVIPTTVLSNTTNLDGVYSKRNIIAIRRIKLSDSGIGSILSGVFSIIITIDKKLVIQTLQDIEQIQPISSTNLGTNPLRFITSNVIEDQHALDFRQSNPDNSTLHSSASSSDLPYEINTIASTYLFSVDAAEESNIGGFYFNLDGLTAFIAGDCSEPILD